MTLMVARVAKVQVAQVGVRLFSKESHVITQVILGNFNYALCNISKIYLYHHAIVDPDDC